MGGRFVISLDFELHWGVRDHASVADYRDNLLGVRAAIPALLRLFARHAIAATWATVGFLFAETKRDLENHFPSLLPTYEDPTLSPYGAMSDVGEDEAHDPFHFAPSLVRAIAKAPRQELATHTFSHFYCLEKGQTRAQFAADLDAAAAIASGLAPFRSIVFPRNQVSASYLGVLEERGIRAYRSNGTHWAYRAAAGERPARRLFRLADSYLSLRDAGVRALRPRPSDGCTDVPASAFLRPYSPPLRRLDDLRRARLRRALNDAAARDGIFHLWWHPHNFGVHLAENLAFLEGVLEDFGSLRRTRGMESVTMTEAAP